MDALEHYKKAEELLGTSFIEREERAVAASRATAHLLASIAATLATNIPGSSSGWSNFGNGANDWVRHLYPHQD